MPIPVSDLYKGAKNVITVQAPRYSIINEDFVISKKAAQNIIQKFKENKSQYDALTGQVNAQADSAGMRLNIRFSETHPGKLEIGIAHKSVPTTREVANEISLMFSDSKNIATHFKSICKMLKGAIKSDSQGGVKKVIVGPEEPYAEKVREALLDVIEARELARH